MNEPFFQCFTIHLHDFHNHGAGVSCNQLMYLPPERYDTCGTPGISCRAVADVRLELSVLLAFALTASGPRRILPP